MSVQHDENNHRFTVALGAYEAALMYARRGDVLDFYHIYVPDPFRGPGRGIAGRILIAAFDYARENNLKVTPTCPFIRNDFLPRFERYRDLIVDGEFPFAD
jgi:hypothetical protein